MALSKADLLRPRVKEIQVKSLGDTVFIRKLSAGDIVGLGEGDVGLIMARSLCDGEGVLLFDESTEALGLPVDALKELMAAVNEYNGLDVEKQEGN